MLDNDIPVERLFHEAKMVRENAYCPYSNFKVGAALLAESGAVYTGANFENASFGAGTCAERVALGNALSNGERSFRAIVIVGGSAPVPPCGICRQALSEFGDMMVFFTDSSGEQWVKRSLSELFDSPFSLTNE